MTYVIQRNVKYTYNTNFSTLELPALFTENGILLSHLRYLSEKRSKSYSWLERNTFAIRLLLTFISRHPNTFPSSTELLRSFVEALQLGTIVDGLDTSLLYWKPRKVEDVNVLLGHINNYCDYLDRINGKALPSINPLRSANSAEERLLWCAYYKRNARCFLNHLNRPIHRGSSYVRHIQAPQRIFSTGSEHTFQFPEGQIDRLIKEGLKEDYCSQLIVMLMHYGGLRLSECFHIYTSDLTVDTKTGGTLASIFHPSDGIAPSSTFRNRREYLSLKYRMKPRNEYARNNRLHSGWKSPALTSRNLSFDVFFYPPHKAIEYTLILQKYLSHRKNGNHPFLFTNSYGEPESKKNFIQKHHRALRRIGLNADKCMGTSCHGHRHAYGYRLKESGFNQLEIQRAMHHKSPDSCLIYIQPSESQVRQRLRKSLGIKA